MVREQAYREIEGMFGLVPSFFHTVPGVSLELEWQPCKRVRFDEGPIPNEYRELIGVALAAAQWRFCITHHTEVARLNGASEAEIEDAVHYAKSSMGWNTCSERDARRLRTLSPGTRAGL
jgi:AhpD family alkylhydroperoxidase